MCEAPKVAAFVLGSNYTHLGQARTTVATEWDSEHEATCLQCERVPKTLQLYMPVALDRAHGMMDQPTRSLGLVRKSFKAERLDGSLYLVQGCLPRHVKPALLKPASHSKA